ncbi:head-tail connector protein [Maricaulis sp. CAU 1757]
MSLKRINPPALLPVTLDEARQRLRIADASQDAAVSHWIAAATARVEAWTGRALLAQTWRARLDGWPCTDFIELAHPPLIAVDSVALYDADGGATAQDLTTFRVDTDAVPGRLVLNEGEAWPRPGRARGGIEIVWRCGHGEAAAEVPEMLREAVLLTVQEMAEEGDAARLPTRAKRLMAPYRRWSL